MGEAFCIGYAALITSELGCGADKIEEMSICFSMIKSHLEDKNKEHALERLHECELMLSEIVENEKLSIKNIM